MKLTNTEKCLLTYLITDSIEKRENIFKDLMKNQELYNMNNIIDYAHDLAVLKGLIKKLDL